MPVRRMKRSRPDISPKAVKRPSLKRITAIVRKSAPPEFTQKKNGKLGPKFGEKPEDQGL